MTPRNPPEPHDKPDPDAAQRNLDAVRERRPHVDRLVAALLREQRLNSFTANITVVLRGARE